MNYLPKRELLKLSVNELEELRIDATLEKDTQESKDYLDLLEDLISQKAFGI